MSSVSAPPRKPLKNQARALAYRVIGWYNLRATRSASPQEIWVGRVDNEIGFWRDWMRTRGSRWPEAYRFRLDPESVIQKDITQHLSGIGSRVRLLDVGAGPLTVVGKRWPGHDLELTAVDALADQYDALLEEYKIAPPVRTRRCDTERLSDVFAPGSFDVVYAKNTIDHGYQPLEAIRQMVAVVRPGGVVLLQHCSNEGENQGYLGLHQWNFDWVNDDCLLWRPGTKWSLRKEFAGQATVTGAKADRSVTVIMTKSGGQNQNEGSAISS